MKTKADRESVLARLEFLRQRNDGILTPSAVVADAKRKGSPLHGQFVWDVQKAAREHWLDRARELIRTFETVVRTEKTSIAVPYYVRDPALPANEQGYRATVEFKADKEASRDVLLDEFGRAAAALRRAKSIAIAFELEDSVEAVARQVDTLRTRVIGEARTN